MPEVPQEVLGLPKFLLVLQAVLLYQLILLLDPLLLPGMRRGLILSPAELRVSQKITSTSLLGYTKCQSLSSIGSSSLASYFVAGFVPYSSIATNHSHSVNVIIVGLG